jgi:hypothetical protein
MTSMMASLNWSRSGVEPSKSNPLADGLEGLGELRLEELLHGPGRSRGAADRLGHLEHVLRVLFTRTKKVTLMSARMLSLQMRPSLPRRSISMVFTEMSMTSARWMIGYTTAPVKVTSGSLLSVLMMRALPWSTWR